MKFTARDAQGFIQSDLPHCLMITNHGLHQWDIIPGLPDTGGQNVYVNQFSGALAKSGYRVTIANRGGYPHPVTGVMRSGTHYKDNRQRILYLEDGTAKFVRKELMLKHIPALAQNLKEHIESENIHVDLIVSHYWDAALLGHHFIQSTGLDIPHIWIPHSLAAIKKKNLSKQLWDELKIDQRVEVELDLLSTIDQVGSTSPLISRSLAEDYHYHAPLIDMPPCIDRQRYHPSPIQDDHPLWNYLSGYSDLTADEIRARRIISEISRSDLTKRKDVLIKAFAAVQKAHADTLLVLTAAGDETLSMQLRTLARELNINHSVIFLGSVSQWLPAIYNASYLYCTPSVMEGFGMSAQEAAACGKPVIASTLVPFVNDCLVGQNPGSHCNNQVWSGSGGITFTPDDIPALSCAMNILLDDPQLAGEMGRQALHKTIPYFTWEERIQSFLIKIKTLTS